MKLLADKYINPGVEGFSPNSIDNLLEQGFFRLQQWMIWSILLITEDDWEQLSFNYKIRTDLTILQDTPESIRIQKRCRTYRVEVCNATASEADEELYRKYLTGINFETAPSIRDLLGEVEKHSNFDTEVIRVYKGKQLIGLGYFDMGMNAMMGILNVWDPAYRTHSLGKFLILQKISLARSRGARYFYPGSLNTLNQKLDYKLFTGTQPVECFLPFDKQWIRLPENHRSYMVDYYVQWLLKPSPEET